MVHRSAAERSLVLKGKPGDLLAAFHADVQLYHATNYFSRVDTSEGASGGTSAVAPLMAALVARLNQAKKKKNVGFLNPFLYANVANGVVHDVTSGTNAIKNTIKGYEHALGLTGRDAEALGGDVGIALGNLCWETGLGLGAQIERRRPSGGEARQTPLHQLRQELGDRL